jgi:hypothetical protein
MVPEKEGLFRVATLQTRDGGSLSEAGSWIGEIREGKVGGGCDEGEPCTTKFDEPCGTQKGRWDCGEAGG